MTKFFSRETCNRFKKLFGKDITGFNDGTMMMLTKQQELDIFKLCEALEVPENVSGEEFIRKEYGEEASKLIKAMIHNKKELYA